MLVWPCLGFAIQRIPFLRQVDCIIRQQVEAWKLEPHGERKTLLLALLTRGIYNFWWQFYIMRGNFIANKAKTQNLKLKDGDRILATGFYFFWSF